MTRPLVVVKIGGSLLADGRLPSVLCAIAAWRGMRLVLVPGGGVFADAVRIAQERAGFDDALAHRLALDAMGRMAEVFTALQPMLIMARDPVGIAAAHSCGRIPVWDPIELRDGDPDIQESWNVTSDSLALWLATLLGAEHLVLLKSAEPPACLDLAFLAVQGLIDSAFPAFARNFDGAIHLLGPSADLTELGSVQEPAAT
jgi:5-(aminomethyl)-3-furanmethanol phosphate kinase